MGTGNKLNPTLLEVVDISKTSVCPLAKVMRYELRKRNIKNVKVLFSTEIPIDLSNNELEKKLLQDEASVKHQIPGSVSFVPSIAGLLIAREIILDLLKG
jgi:tRNA A37 threonylcarbamoyladenosine dehydratase